MSRKKSQQNRACCYITFRIKPQQVAQIVGKLATKRFVEKRGTLLRFLIRALFATLVYVRFTFRGFCSVQPRNLGHTHENSRGCSDVFTIVLYQRLVKRLVCVSSGVWILRSNLCILQYNHGTVSNRMGFIRITFIYTAYAYLRMKCVQIYINNPIHHAITF